METKAASWRQIGAALQQAQDKLNEFRAEPRSLPIEDRRKHARRLAELEERVAAARSRWLELDGAEPDVWQQMQSSVEGTWEALQAEIEEAIAEVR